MPVQEFLFTVDPRTDKNLSSINEQLRSLTNREDPLTLDNFISFDVIGYSGLRSVVIRVTMEVNAFYARTTFPVNGAAFSQTAAPQAIKLVFNSKIDEGSITGTSIKYNGANVAANKISLESDGYTLSVDTSGLSYNALQTHTVELISLKDRKGNGLSKQDIFSYVVGTSGSATSDRGNPEPYTYRDKLGDFKVTSFVIDRYAKIADKITEYLKTNKIDRDSVIAQDILNVNEHTLEVYILYFSDLFPSVIRTFPQEGALVSSDGVPTEAVITFSQPTHINITEANNITIGGVDISANATLSDDKKTVKVGIGSISAGNHFIKINNVYNELGRVRPNPPIAIGFTAGDIADNGGSGPVGSTGDTGAITGILVDIGTPINGSTNPLVTLGGDTFVTVSGSGSGQIDLVFDESQINHANIQGGDFTSPSNISPSVTNQFISAISFNTHGHVASVVRSGVVPASIDHGSLGGLSDNDHPQYFLSGSFNSPGIVISNGSGTVSINSANADNIANWNTAYSWGNHGESGYITAVVEDTTPQLGGDLDASGRTIDMGANLITDTKVGQWDTAYDWGDHSLSGYLTAHPSVSAADNVDNSGPTFIQDLSFDSFGHVTAVGSAPVTPPVIGALDGSNISGPGVIVSTGNDSGVTTTGTVNDYVSGVSIIGPNVSGVVNIDPAGTGEIVVTGFEREVPSGTLAQYYRGDKTFATLDATNVANAGAFMSSAFSGVGQLVISDGDGTVSFVNNNHNELPGYETNQHINWAAGSAGTIDVSNIPGATISTAGLMSGTEKEKLSYITVASAVNLNSMQADIEKNSGNHTGHTGRINNPHQVSFTDLIDTNISSAAKGDIYYGSSASTVANLSIGSAGSFLKVSASNAPSWADITFTDIDISSFSPGDVLYIDSNTSVTGEATGNGNAGKFLKQGTDGYPTWATAASEAAVTTLSDLDNVNDSVNEGAVAAGSLFYYNGTTWATLDPPNSVDHLLISTGSATNMPYWTGAIERLTGTWLNSSELSQIGDVSVTTPSNGDVLKYATGEWVPSDVVLSFNSRVGAVSPAADDYTWDQIDKTDSTLTSIADVQNLNLDSGDLLVWRNTGWYGISTSDIKGSGGGGSSTITGLDDTDINDPENGSLLVYNSAISKYANAFYVNTGGYHQTQTHEFLVAPNAQIALAGILRTDSVGTETSSDTGRQTINTLIYSPGYRSVPEELDFYVSSDWLASLFTIGADFDAIFKVYPVEINSGIHTTGASIGHFTSSFPQNSFGIGNIVLDPYTGNNVYLSVVFEEQVTTGNITAAGNYHYYSQMDKMFYAIKYRTVGISSTPGGSSANLVPTVHPEAGKINDEIIYKSVTNDQEISSNIKFASGKGIEFNSGHAPSTYGAVDKATLVSYVGDVDLPDLRDVSISSLSSGQIIKYDGSDWVNADESGGGSTDLGPAEAFSWFVG